MDVMLPEWRKRWDGVEHNLSELAAESGVSASTISGIITGERKNYGKVTGEKLIAALDRVRGTCPRCGQEMPHKGARNATVQAAGRRVKGRG